MKVAVSFISSNYDLKSTIGLIDKTDADYIHVDVMDGIFVENHNFGKEDLVDLFKGCNKGLDVHLMCVDPLSYLDVLKSIGAKRVSVHVEIENVGDVIKRIKELGMEVGLSLNPDTRIDVVEDYLNDIDSLLVMSVVPGKGGQTFLESVLPKLDDLNALRSSYDFEIHIDGGINNETIGLVYEMVDMVISGSYVCKSDDYQGRIDTLR